MSASWELGPIQGLEVEQRAPQGSQGRSHYQHPASAGTLWPGRAAERWGLPAGPWVGDPEVSYVLPSLFLPRPICHTSPIRPKAGGVSGVKPVEQVRLQGMRGQRREGPQAKARRGEDRTEPERDILRVRGGVL